MEDQAEKFRQQKKHNGLLLVAASRGYQADVEALLEMGAALDCKDKPGRTPLHYAAANGRAAVVRFLWSRGAEVDAETPEGRTPLHLAAQGGHVEVVTFLLQKGAWAEAYDAQDETPLHLAARHGHTGVLEALLKHGTKPGIESKQGLTALGCALVGGHVAAAKLLQGWGASLLDKPHGYSLLHLAAGLGMLPSVTFLLDSGADPNEHSNSEGVSPLHSAAMGGCTRCAQALLDAGADPGLPDVEGRLPAELAGEQDPRMRELLKPKPSAAAASAAAKARSSATGGAAGALSPPKTAQETFRGLPKAEQLSKVERWSLLEAADLAAALRQYPLHAAAEVTARVGQLAAARRLLNIHKAQAALHADEDFQADAAQPGVRAAIDAIRADPSRYDHYAADPQILAVMQKMRRLHSVSQANGQRTVSIDDMLAQPGFEKKDAERQLAIEATCSAHLAAAAAAAAADAADATGVQEAAQAAYDASLQEAREAAVSVLKGKGKGPTVEAAAAAGAAPNSTASILRQRMGGGNSGSGRAAGSATGGSTDAAAEAAARVLEESERRRDADEDLPEWLRGEFSWKKVGAEFLAQTKRSLLVLLVFLLASWLVRGRAPWVS